MKYFCIILLCAYLSGSVKAQNCHLRELDLCAATLLVFTNNPDENTGSNEEIERQCGFIREAEECHNNYTAKCATEAQRELIDFLGTGGSTIADEFCTPGTKMRTDYQKHAKCMSGSRKEAKKCTKDLRAALEVISNSPWDKRILTSCCAFNRFDDCLEDHLLKKCGQEALDVSRKMMRLAVSRLPEIICKSYDSKSEKCVSALPKPGTAPSGGKAQSLLQRVFATYVNNQD